MDRDFCVLVGSRVVNISGQHIATVENGSEDERALLAAAYLVFLQ